MREEKKQKNALTSMGGMCPYIATNQIVEVKFKKEIVIIPFDELRK